MYHFIALIPLWWLLVKLFILNFCGWKVYGCGWSAPKPFIEPGKVSVWDTIHVQKFTLHQVNQFAVLRLVRIPIRVGLFQQRREIGGALTNLFRGASQFVDPHGHILVWLTVNVYLLHLLGWAGQKHQVVNDLNNVVSSAEHIFGKIVFGSPERVAVESYSRVYVGSMPLASLVLLAITQVDDC